MQLASAVWCTTDTSNVGGSRHNNTGSWRHPLAMCGLIFDAYILASCVLPLSRRVLFMLA